MRGDGTLELTSMAGPSKPVPVVAEDNINTFSVQTFTDIDSVQWDRSSTLTKLVTIATVCNKAKFVYADTDACRCLLTVTAPAFTGQLASQLSTCDCGSQSHTPVVLTCRCAANKSPDHMAVTVPMFKGGADDRKTLGDATDTGLLRYCDRLAPSGLVRMAYKKVSCSLRPRCWADVGPTRANRISLLCRQQDGDPAGRAFV